MSEDRSDDAALMKKMQTILPLGALASTGTGHLAKIIALVRNWPGEENTAGSIRESMNFYAAKAARLEASLKQCEDDRDKWEESSKNWEKLWNEAQAKLAARDEGEGELQPGMMLKTWEGEIWQNVETGGIEIFHPSNPPLGGFLAEGRGKYWVALKRIRGTMAVPKPANDREALISRLREMDGRVANDDRETVREAILALKDGKEADRG